MKRLVSYLMVIALLLGCIGMLSACGGEEANTYTLPEGYTMYEDEYISFAYPSHWTTTDGSTVMLQNTENTNNITVVYEAATDVYETMTKESFETTMVPAFEAAGMQISDTAITQNTRGDLKITEISITTTLYGITMKQTMYMTTVSDRTYVITVTEVVSDPAIAENVFASLSAVK